MQYRVQIKRINSDFEEEILIQIHNIELMCFVGCWEKNVKEGHFYDVDIHITILDELEMKEQDEEITGFKQIGDSFAYIIRGKLEFDTHTIDAGLLMEFDPSELSDYSYLDGKYVSARVDRIALDFIPKT